MKGFINREARSESLRLVRGNPPDLEISSIDTPPDAPEVIYTLLDELKPRQYAALAVVLNKLLDHVEATPLASYFTKVPIKSMREANMRLRSYALSAFLEGIGLLGDTPEYHQAAAYPELIGSLDPERHSNLKTQLFAGADTAITNILTFTNNLPAILKYHAPQVNWTTEDFSRLARSSRSLSWNMAMLCVNQMMALQTAVTPNLQAGQSWGSGEAKLDPDFFKLKWSQGAVAGVEFTNLEAMTLPVGYTPHDSIPELTTPTPLPDLKCNQLRTIGCPITLLPKRLSIFRHWVIDAIDAKDLWDLPEK